MPFPGGNILSPEIFLSWDSAPELAAKDLCAQEGKDAEKEKEEDEEGHDRLNRVDQRTKQVLKGSPVPETRIRLNFCFLT